MSERHINNGEKPRGDAEKRYKRLCTKLSRTKMIHIETTVSTVQLEEGFIINYSYEKLPLLSHLNSDTILSFNLYKEFSYRYRCIKHL